MNRIKAMLTFIFVTAGIAGMFAFNAKTPNVCAYAGVLNSTATVAICNLTHASVICANNVMTTVGLSTQYAATRQCAPLPCPLTAQCFKSRTLTAEQ